MYVQKYLDQMQHKIIIFLALIVNMSDMLLTIGNILAFIWLFLLNFLSIFQYLWDLKYESIHFMYKHKYLDQMQHKIIIF